MRKLMLMALLLSGWRAGVAEGGPAVEKVEGQVEVLMLSDFHFDPFRDAAKVVRLAEVPASGWEAILEEPASADAAAGAAAMQTACKSRGSDSDFALVDASLKSAKLQGAGVKAVVVSGDMLVHQFPCRYKMAMAARPALNNGAGYLDFTAKTMNYLVGRLKTDFPGAAIYVSLGNNDSGCGDYMMDEGDPFLRGTVSAVAKGWVGVAPGAVQQAAEEYRIGGYYNVPLVGVTKGRMIVLNDIFMSDEYKPCSQKAAKDGEKREEKWLEKQLTEAGKKGEQVWVMGHIPPGVDIYATARKVKNLCSAEGAPEMFMTDEVLAETLGRHADVVRLAVFGHTHTDELRLLGNVPVKMVPSISPINGNVAAYTLGKVSAATGVLQDYSVYMATGGKDGTPLEWTKEYGFRGDVWQE